MKQKAPINAPTLTGAGIRTAEAGRTLNSIIRLLAVDLKEIPAVTCHNCRVRGQHIQARQVSIAERRKPDLRGQPGLCHLNVADTVTQWQVVG